MRAGTKEGFSPYLLHQIFFQSEDPRGLRIRTLASVLVGSGHIHTQRDVDQARRRDSQ